MASLLFANNASSTLAGPITSTATTINLSTGTGALFPSPSSGQYFKLSLTDAATKTVQEILHVTAKSGDALTVVRGQESTAPANWLAGDLAENRITAATLAAFAQSGSLPSVIYIGTDSGTANALAVPTTSPVLSAPSAGQVFLVTKSPTAGANTGPVTLSIAGSAAYSTVYADGTALSAGDFQASASALLYFTGGVMQVIALGLPATRIIHKGVDNGTATALTVTVDTAISGYADGDFFTIRAANAAGAAPTLNVNSKGARPILRCDLTQAQANDWPATGELPLIYSANSNAFILAAPTIPQIVALVTTNTTITNLINSGTPAGSTKLRAFQAGLVNNDIAQTTDSPPFTTVLTTGNFVMPASNAWLRARGNCALRNYSATSGTTGGTIRFQVNDVTAGTSVQGDYLGGGVAVAGAQVGLGLPEVDMAMVGGHTYNVSIVAQKGSGGAQTQTFDPSIRLEHNGTNS